MSQKSSSSLNCSVSMEEAVQQQQELTGEFEDDLEGEALLVDDVQDDHPADTALLEKKVEPPDITKHICVKHY